MDDAQFIRSVIDYLSDKVEGEILAGIGVIIAIVYKMYRIIVSDRKGDTLSDDQESFRKDLLQQMVDLREENAQLKQSCDKFKEQAFSSKVSLKNIKLNLQIFRSVLTNKTNDDNLIHLFDNIVSYDKAANETSLRSLGFSSTVASRLISNSRPNLNARAAISGERPNASSLRIDDRDTQESDRMFSIELTREERIEQMRRESGISASRVVSRNRDNTD